MGAPAEVLDEIFTVIQGGQTVGTSAEIIQFPSDNGSRTIEAVNKTFKGTNGTGINYLVACVQQGAAAISAGALFLTVSIPEFIAFAVPCLGIAVGTAFYNIDPDGWTNLSLQLYNAGWTVKDKVTAFMIDKGIIAFPPETIEILKDELLRLGVFEDRTAWDGNQPASFELSEPIIGSEKTFSVEFTTHTSVNYYGGSLYNPNDGYSILGISKPDEIEDIIVTSAIVNGHLHALASSKTSQPNSRFSAGAWAASTMTGTWLAITTQQASYTYDNKTVYWGRFNLDDYSGTDSIGTNAANLGDDLDILAQLAWILQYGTFSEDDYKKYYQTDADLPVSGVPIPAKYPDWLPWEFPDLTGWQIPMVYPAQYPQLLPKEGNYQDPAQNPEGDDDTAEEGVGALEDPAKNPQSPASQPDPAPDPEPVPGEIDPDPLPSEDPDTPPDPISPDPDIPPTPAIVVPPLPDTVHSNKLFTVYNPNATQLGLLGGYLWDDDLIDILRKIWQNPMDGIISLIQVYATPTVGSPDNIILGYLDSGVPAPIVTSQFATINCGTITVPEISENCLDYIPYTKLSLYLPFIGIVELDTNEFMSGSINVTYKVDVYTGTCLAEVKCTRTRDLPNGTILYTFSGNCSQQLPLTGGDAKGLFGALLSAVGVGLSVASGGASMMAIGGAVAGDMVKESASKEMLHVSHSGNLSANAGIMGQKKPYLIINRERAYTANSYNKYNGYPANVNIIPGNHSGFLRLKSGRLRSAATQAEKNEIFELLTTGVIM